MDRRQVAWLSAAFAICYFAGGWLWWSGSYEDFLQTGFHLSTFPLLAGVSMALTWIKGSSVLVSAAVVGSAFPAIMLTRVILDCIQDPTRHNLWPFEVMTAFLFGVIMAFPAAWIGERLRRITHRA